MPSEIGGAEPFGGPRGFNYVQWAGLLHEAHIAIKELVPLVLAAALWGRQWKGRTILCRSDNTAVVAAINNTSKVKESAHLLRCLAFICASFQCQLRASHIPGPHNTVADALSRNNLVQFYSVHPQAQARPTTIPAELIQLLIIDKPALLDSALEFYFSNRLAPSTRKTYSTSIKRYSLEFCHSFSTPPIPTSEQLLCRFITSLALQNISANTIKVYLSAVRQLHLQSGADPPVTEHIPRLNQVLRSIRIVHLLTPGNPGMKTSHIATSTTKH